MTSVTVATGPSLASMPPWPPRRQSPGRPPLFLCRAWTRRASCPAALSLPSPSPALPVSFLAREPLLRRPTPPRRRFAVAWSPPDESKRATSSSSSSSSSSPEESKPDARIGRAAFFLSGAAEHRQARCRRSRPPPYSAVSTNTTRVSTAPF